MKVVHIVYSMQLGGIEIMLANIVNEQINHAKVSILVINNAENPSIINNIDKRVNIIRIGRTIGSKNPWSVIKLNLTLCKLKNDIIHLHSPSISKYILLPSFKKKICVTQHNICTKTDAKYLHECNKIFSISGTVKENIKRVTGLSSEVVLNGIKADLIISKFPKSKEVIFKIIQISRLTHEIKGQHILIEAVKILRDKGFLNIQLSFIGEGNSESYLKNLCQQYKLQDKIFFLGPKSQEYIFQNLCQYDLLVQPSIFEGFGLTVAEGMAAKIPVLVSENQGPLEIIENGKYGFYFKNGDAEDCADMIFKIMNGGVNDNMIEEAYNRVCNSYNVENTARTYLQKYAGYMQLLKK